MPLNHTTRGRVIAVNGSTVVFKPTNSTYELHLHDVGGYTGPLDTPLDAIIRGTARKIYTVPSGGGFVTPIMGTPKIVQGRVADVSAAELTVKAAATVNVTLPKADNAVEMANGTITSGALVNVVLMAGATFEAVTVAA